MSCNTITVSTYHHYKVIDLTIKIPVTKLYSLIMYQAVHKFQLLAHIISALLGINLQCRGLRKE
jgi:hypothetical protein